MNIMNKLREKMKLKFKIIQLNKFLRQIKNLQKASQYRILKNFNICFKKMIKLKIKIEKLNKMLKLIMKNKSI